VVVRSKQDSVRSNQDNVRSRRAGRVCSGLEKNYQQLSGRHAPPFIRDVMAGFRKGHLSTTDAIGELGLSRSRFYVLYADYLRA